jgi:serine/threonine protein kinase
MIALTNGNTTMLYCPKCRRTYEDGTQRFCDNDGGRLLPAPSAQNSDSATGGVFSNLLGKTQATGDADKKINPAPRFIPLNKTEESDKKLTSFPSVGRIFQSEQFLKPKSEDLSEAEDSILELDPLPVREEKESVLEFEPIPPTEKEEINSVESPEESPEELPEEAQKPLPRLINPYEIASGTADIGNRQTNPIGRQALSWDNTEALLGQTVKGRYLVLEELEADDEDSLIYLAEDQIFDSKKTVVRVFMNDGFGAGDLEEKVFAEERVSLSHLNHPNIAGVFDSGELPEGNDFIVSEFVEGKTLAEMLQHTGQFNSLRTARIIRQISYALSEAHQNGILHRNLKPENIVLTVSEAGIEQVKLMNFGMAHSEITDANIAYKAPEEIERGISTFASDIYSLAVIAYQMLTARLPFNTNTDNALLKAQKAGLTLLPTGFRLDIQPLADRILEKALAYNASERYPKARDFGDAFFNALTTAAPWSNEEESEIEPPEFDEIEAQREFFVVPAINPKDVLGEESPIAADIHITPKDDGAEIAEVKATEDLAWEKRSPEPPKTGSSWRGWLAIFGVVALLLTFWGMSRLLLNRSNQVEGNQNQENTPVSPTEKTLDNSLTSGESDIAPQQRLQKTLPNTQRFQNNRENLSENLAKNFLGFEIFYPQDWTKNSTDTNFLDISKRDSNDFPIEQMIVTRYESRGTMTLDKPNFPKIVEKSNQDLKKSLGESFKVISEGDALIQNGRWKVYEVKFQSSSVNEKGEKVTVWGKRLWLPVQRAGVQNGFVITLLATSLSETVKSADDVGTRGELANVLETFEPEQF